LQYPMTMECPHLVRPSDATIQGPERNHQSHFIVLL
jgi:hypothetical protein